MSATRLRPAVRSLGSTLVLALVLGARIGGASAEPVGETQLYRVKAGDTLGMIAAEYYGDRTRIIYLADANRLSLAKPVVLRPGTRLRVPVSRTLVTKAGDTFPALAAQYLGDERRGDVLARMNELVPAMGLAAGTEITIPLVVTHTPAAPESLAAVAQRYLGDSKQSEVIAAFNGLDKDSLDAGEAILVPVFTVTVSPSKLPAIDADSRLRKRTRPQMARLAATALTKARSDWDAARYGAIIAALSALDTLALDTPTAVEIDVALGCAYVARGSTRDGHHDQDDAVVAFQRALARRPGRTLDPFLYSPKILGVWTRAGGT